MSNVSIFPSTGSGETEAAAGGGSIIKRLTSTFTNAGSSNQNVTDLEIDLEGGKTYLMQGKLHVKNGGNTGIKIRASVAENGSNSRVNFGLILGTQQNTIGANERYANSFTMSSSFVEYSFDGTHPYENIVIVHGILTPVTSVPFRIGIAEETSGTGNVSMFVGSWVKVEEILL